jgi:hypothetical protein
MLLNPTVLDTLEDDVDNNDGALLVVPDVDKADDVDALAPEEEPTTGEGGETRVDGDEISLLELRDSVDSMRRENCFFKLFIAAASKMSVGDLKAALEKALSTLFYTKVVVEDFQEGSRDTLFNYL